MGNRGLDNLAQAVIYNFILQVERLGLWMRCNHQSFTSGQSVHNKRRKWLEEGKEWIKQPDSVVLNYYSEISKIDRDRLISEITKKIDKQLEEEFAGLNL